MAMVVGYVCVSTVLLVLFWPEAIRFAGRSGETEPDRVASYAAMRDPGAMVITARDTGLLPEGFQAPALFPTGFRLLHGCYLPAKTRLLQRADGLGLPLTFQDFLPWGGSQLQQELPLIEVTPGQRSGLVAPPAAFSRDRRYDETKCWAFSTFFCP
jgi:hypothetical protein